MRGRAVLTGEYRNPRLFDVTMALCVEMLISGQLAKDDASAWQTAGGAG
ncbi:hypothetical protein KCP76_13280 [Salmonella enterica subsp. enterica serovar Weltevreden]|nr:hypothetical protein KCP76_13280 [Salmonella enterica subsp. enterica serovar Weltevreden]